MREMKKDLQGLKMIPWERALDFANKHMTPAHLDVRCVVLFCFLLFFMGIFPFLSVRVLACLWIP